MGGRAAWSNLGMPGGQRDGKMVFEPILRTSGHTTPPPPTITSCPRGSMQEDPS